MNITTVKNLKKTILLLAILLGVISLGYSQQLIDKEGRVSFYSEAPLEDIEAQNEKALGAIDMSKGTIAASMMIKDFEFDKSLMQEHFNENYLESEKYPKAKFSGQISNWNEINLQKDGEHTGRVTGTIEIHGVKKPFQADVIFDVSGAEITANTKFDITLKDFKVKIPKMLFKNIAEVVEVKANFNFNGE